MARASWLYNVGGITVPGVTRISDEEWEKYLPTYLERIGKTQEQAQIEVDGILAEAMMNPNTDSEAAPSSSGGCNLNLPLWAEVVRRSAPSQAQPAKREGSAKAGSSREAGGDVVMEPAEVSGQASSSGSSRPRPQNISEAADDEAADQLCQILDMEDATSTFWQGSAWAKEGPKAVLTPAKPDGPPVAEPRVPNENEAKKAVLDRHRDEVPRRQKAASKPSKYKNEKKKS